MLMNCSVNYEQVREAFFKAPPAIAASIKDKSINHPSFNADLPEYRQFPLGEGVTLTEIIHRGEMPEYEVDLGRWKKMEGEAGCNDCTGPDCGYNWSVLGGNSFDSRSMTMMDRDFRTQVYCVKAIQTTYQYSQLFEKIVDNISRQIDFHKEFNIAQNVLLMLSKKYLVDNAGIKINQADPYTFPNLGVSPNTVVISALNLRILSRFYSVMRRMTDVVPYDMQNGRPVFGLQASEEVLADMYRDDPEIRQDIRYSSQADDLLKYAFLYTIRGMFIVMPNDFLPRYSVTAAGQVQRISPFVNGVPAEFGSYSANNPAYEMAPFEGILMHGKNPFALYTMPTATTIGGGTDFGPEVSWFDNLKWINPETDEDPFRRSGYFATHATLGVAPQNSEGIFQLLVPRSIDALFSNRRQPVALVVGAGTPANVIPAQACPCPQVRDFGPNPILPTRIYMYFWTPIAGAIDSTVTFGLTNGGYKSGLLKALSADGLTAEIDFGAGFVASQCLQFVSIYCANTLVCSSYVLGGSQCRSESTGAFDLFLEAPIYADAVNDVVWAYFGDGSVTRLSVVSINQEISKWRFRYAAGYGPTDNPTGTLSGSYGTGGVYLGNSDDALPLAGDFFCDRGIPVRLCVPPATEALCPACSAKGPVITQCA